MGPFAGINLGLNGDERETIRRLTVDIVSLKEDNTRLEQDRTIAVGARSAAVHKIRDLEDVLRLKDQLSEEMERQLEGAEARIAELSAQLATRDRELAAFRHEQESFPLSDMDLLHRHQLQTGLFEQIQEALTCPICYEFFGRNSAVSLLCGHSFCDPCFKSWEEKHLASFKLSTQQGAYRGPDCPECRSTDVRRGRVRIWAMEEIVRLVERGTKDLKKPYTPPPLETSPSATDAPPAPSVVLPAAPPPPHEDHPMDGVQHPDPDEPVVDEDAASLLRPRTRLPYGGST